MKITRSSCGKEFVNPDWFIEDKNGNIFCPKCHEERPEIVLATVQQQALKKIHNGIHSL